MKRLSILLILLGVMTFLLVPGVLADQTIYAKALDDHECDSSEWHFVINQVESEELAPTSIHVVWANGGEEDVGLSAFTGGVAHYVTTSNLDSAVVSASATIYDDWSGEFNLSHGPCLEEPTPTPTPEEPTPTPPVEEPTPTPTPTEVTPTATPREVSPTPTPPAESPPTAGPGAGLSLAQPLLGLFLLALGGLAGLRRKL